MPQPKPWPTWLVVIMCGAVADAGAKVVDAISKDVANAEVVAKAKVVAND